MATKPVSFKKKEQDLLDFVEGKDFSYYVKNLIREDINKKERPILVNKPIESNKKRKINYEI
ncbi:MAG: hypothetical protein KIC94_18725 [Clostridiales bacterium]|nr:hypothetical protein [Clostridiales bacterium]